MASCETEIALYGIEARPSISYKAIAAGVLNFSVPPETVLTREVAYEQHRRGIYGSKLFAQHLQRHFSTLSKIRAVLHSRINKQQCTKMVTHTLVCLRVLLDLPGARGRQPTPLLGMR